MVSKVRVGMVILLLVAMGARSVGRLRLMQTRRERRT
jgi:hypothetical protein